MDEDDSSTKENQEPTDQQPNEEPNGAVPAEKEPVVATDSNGWQENAAAAKVTHKEKFGKIRDFFRSYWARKKWTLPVTVFALLAILLAIPVTRYDILGLFIKHDITISVLDSTTEKPVSGASVAAGGRKVTTNASGQAKLHLAVGPHQLTISKKYYKANETRVTVKLFGQQVAEPVHLIATGRQVPITITNKFTGKGLANVEISVLDTDTKTDKNGKAIIALPTASATQKASLHLAGYNTSSVTVQITDQAVPANSFTLTPSGKLYFLSNLSGKIDVVKTSLDGTDRQTVLAGTGKEDPYTTALLASRDWKYLALLSKRSGQQGIYLINTATDNVTNIDGGSNAATFTLVGWSDDTFVYQVNRSGVQNWQSGAQALKSYDANGSRLYSIDQTQGEGTGQFDYAYNTFGTVSILDSELTYTKSWYGNNGHLTGKNDSFVSVHPDGSGKRDVKDFPVPDGTQYGYTVASEPYESYGVYVQVPNNDGSANAYYSYEDGKLTQRTDVNDDTYNKQYPTFLLSPSDKSTFWSEIRDNKNTLFIGNGDGQNGQQIASLSAYTPYGWYTDNYVLVSEGGSELFIMPADGSRPPVKITDYYKPQLTFRGYGGGYGGF